MLLATIALSITPLFQTDEQSQTHIGRGGIEWFDGTYDQALAEAARLEKPLLIEFWANWCGWCKKHEQENLVDPAVRDALGAYLIYGADVSMDDDGNFLHAAPARLMQRFGVQKFPAMVILRADGQPEAIVSGYVPARKLVSELTRIAGGDRTRTYWERKMRSEPEELEWRYEYALILARLGDFAGYQREMDTIAARDPEKVSLPGRRAVLHEMREMLWGCMRDPDIAPDPQGLGVFLRKEEHPELLTDGWLLMGTVQADLGNKPYSRECYRKAWNHAPSDMLPAVGNGIAWSLWLERAELSEADLRFSLRVAIAATRAFEKTCYDDAALAPFYDTLACCYYMNGKRRKAIEVIKRVIEWDPQAEYQQRLELFESRG